MYSIIIPALNPGKNLLDYCLCLRTLTNNLILLVDDGSDESHAEIFDECASKCERVLYLRHNKNRGKGRALKTAFIYLLENYPDCEGCVTADADGQHIPQDVIHCLDILHENPNALVLGTRTFSNGNVPWKSKFGNKTMTLMFRLVTGHVIRDTQTGLRAFSADFMRELINVEGERFDFETHMLLAIHDKPLIQTPISTIYENDNESSHFNPICDSTHIFSIILNRALCGLLVFAVTSMLSFFVDIGLFYFIYNFALTAHSTGHLFISVALARIVSIIFNYIANRYVVFAESTKKHAFGKHSFAKYLLLAAGMLCCSYVFTKEANVIFPKIDITLLKAIVDVILFVANFTIQRFFVFKPKSAPVSKD